tara:strand:+ start:857 stop:1030 length:174 start_codon:yes stop_codon:yes gene_type:complete
MPSEDLLEDAGTPPVYVRKNRELYSGMVLGSMFKVLRRAIVVIVILGVLLMFDPFLF